MQGSKVAPGLTQSPPTTHAPVQLWGKQKVNYPLGDGWVNPCLLLPPVSPESQRLLMASLSFPSHHCSHQIYAISCSFPPPLSAGRALLSVPRLICINSPDNSFRSLPAAGVGWSHVAGFAIHIVLEGFPQCGRAFPTLIPQTEAQQ